MEREQSARHEAEHLLETKSLELFAANQKLIQLNAELERRVQARTRQVDDARKAAVKVGSTDYLTGVANRLHYSSKLECSLARTLGNGTATGLLLLDLDGFKTVNDTYGHYHGDQLLVTIASRLKSLSRRGELVARVGGDEFVVIIEARNAAAICRAAKRFCSIFRQPVTIHGTTIECRASLGLAISPDHSDNPADLQRFADLALYKSKTSGHGHVVVFETGFLHAYEYRQRMEAEFRSAVDGGSIGLVYQPIVNLESGAIEAVEALARWSDSDGSPISPAYFIPLAERCGIIRGVGRSLLEKALFETKGWMEGGQLQRVSFNVSPLELVDESFSDAVLAVLAKVRVDPRHLLLEITEGAVVPNMALAERVLGALRMHGVTFALDDFGCGYSDLSTLRKLNISVLKIDRSLLVDSDRDRSARVILRSVVALCRELGIRSICEGAETATQMEFLRLIRCDLVQGFATGRPLPAAELGQLLSSRGEAARATVELPRPRLRVASRCRARIAR